jgi:hypothetical protein
VFTVGAGTSRRAALLVLPAQRQGPSAERRVAARRYATEYLEIEHDSARRDEIYAKLLDEINVIKQLPEKYRARIREEEKLMALLHTARETHDAPTMR